MQLISFKKITKIVFLLIIKITTNNFNIIKTIIIKTGGLGFEPRLTESESVVLPLDDPPSK